MKRDCQKQNFVKMHDKMYDEDDYDAEAETMVMMRH